MHNWLVALKLYECANFLFLNWIMGIKAFTADGYLHERWTWTEFKRSFPVGWREFISGFVMMQWLIPGFLYYAWEHKQLKKKRRQLDGS